VTPEMGNQLFDRLLAKMKEVGYTNFELGLPGNLIPVRREDSVTLDLRWGGPSKEDGSDGFQIYENGGATASYAFYTIAALYQLGRLKDGDSILFPILKAVKAGGFEGRGPMASPTIGRPGTALRTGTKAFFRTTLWFWQQPCIAPRTHPP